MKILQICFRVPFPPHDGGALAMYSITKGLSKSGHDVTVLAINTPKHLQEETVLNDLAKLIAVYVDTSVSLWKAFLNLFKKYPYNIERFISREFEHELIKILKDEKFDVVHFEGMYVACYVDAVIKAQDVPTVLRTHNLEHLIWERLAKNEKNIFKKWYFNNLSQRLRKFEEKYFKKFHAIASISPEDAKVIKLAGAKNVEVVPFGIDTGVLNHTGIIVQPKTMFILSALEWKPNLEALEWFLHQVWPFIHKKMPDLQLHIAGKRTPQRILNLNIPNVFVHGFIPDAAEFMQKYDLMLVPLLSGSGTRIKILEGMASGKCIITSTMGAEGMEYLNGKNILIANTPEEWLSLISEYFMYPDKYKNIGTNALQFVKEKYNSKMVNDQSIELYKKLQ